MNVRVAVLGVVVASVALAGCALNPDPEPPKPTPTPSLEALTEVFLAALEARDFDAAVACLAPEMVRRMARDYAWSALTERTGIGWEWEKSRAKRGEPRLTEEQEAAARRYTERRDAMLDKHGIDGEGLDRRSMSKDQAQDAVVAKIRNPAGFVADYLRLKEVPAPEWKERNARRARLVDLVIEGETATGNLLFYYQIVDKGGKGEGKAPITFVKKADTGWRIDDFPRALRFP